ncbi:galectin 17 [Myripristis murdjan]|uniref:Uncharacterized LOC115367387 n=1 Tax=Myripristis murdjan TaxID=586833 RepID=A0A667XDB4_9TELE|nr:uncharacterized protein LOC115367387 [Myripristis murdjan]
MASQRAHWYLPCLQSLLISTLVEASALPPHSSTPVPVSSLVGGQAVLPCSWTSRLSRPAASACRVQWQTPVGRAEVPEERLEAGDCSLVVNDVQFGDVGLYESVLLLQGERPQRTVIIQSVRLAVFDHKSVQSRAPGEDMVLQLHTPRALRVVFQDRNGSEWSDLWTRGEAKNPRMQKDPDREQLTLRSVQRSDEGMYKVLDEQGLAVSTVQLTVEEGGTALKIHHNQESQVLLGDVSRSGCWTPRAALGLVSGLLILHLV